MNDLCEVCRDREAVVLHNPPRSRWLQICDQCDVIELDQVMGSHRAGTRGRQ